MPSAGTATDGHKLQIFQVQLLSTGGPPALAPPTSGSCRQRSTRQLILYVRSGCPPCRAARTSQPQPLGTNISNSNSEHRWPTSSGSAGRWQCPPPARSSTATNCEYFKFSFSALAANQLWLRRPVAMPCADMAVDGHNVPIFRVQLLSLGGQPAPAFSKSQQPVIRVAFRCARRLPHGRSGSRRQRTVAHRIASDPAYPIWRFFSVDRF